MPLESAAPAHDAGSALQAGNTSHRDLARLAYLARQIHRLGERPLFELFRELEAGAPLLPRLEAYARLDATFIKDLGGDRLTPLRSIAGGRGDAA
jgi:hypothetical protein